MHRSLQQSSRARGGSNRGYQLSRDESPVRQRIKYDPKTSSSLPWYSPRLNTSPHKISRPDVAPKCPHPAVFGTHPVGPCARAALGPSLPAHTRRRRWRCPCEFVSVSIIHPRPTLSILIPKPFAQNEEFRSALEEERMPHAALGVPPPAAASAGCRFRRCRSSSCVLRERSRCASVCSRPSSASSSRARTWDTQRCSLGT